MFLNFHNIILNESPFSLNHYTSNIILNEAYPFGIWIDYPPNLPTPNQDSVYTTRFLRKASSVESYDSIVQIAINYDIQIKKEFISLAKQYGLVYNLAYQVHSDDGSLNLGNGDGWALREPSNEEIRLQAYLGMAYGAKQLEQYSYYSYNGQRDGHWVYSLGLMDAYQNSANNYPRYHNYYGQVKWDSVLKLNKTLKALGNYMYPPGEITKHLVHDNTKNVNNLGCSNCENIPYSYLQNLTSFYNSNGNWNDTTTLSKDATDKRYYDIGFFNDPNNNLNKYMLIVNKRCVPVQGGYGDLRTVKLFFNGLSDFHNWELKDILTREKIVFATNNGVGNVYFPHPFQPGEGKLFKLAPVMQEGGELVCDEEIGENISEFDCKELVISYEKNIIIPNKVTINFYPEGRISMSGAQFICGTNLTNREIIFKGKGNSQWNGFNFTDCSNIDIENCKFISIMLQMEMEI